jgi:hypothetical protein
MFFRGKSLEGSLRGSEAIGAMRRGFVNGANGSTTAAAKR